VNYGKVGLTGLSFLLKIYRHNSFQNISYLTIGSFLAQIISLFGFFFIPRLLGPEKYGIYQTVIAYVAMFTIVTFSGLNKVILRESSRNLDTLKILLEDTVALKHFLSFLAIALSALIALLIDYDTGTTMYIFVFSFSLWLKAFGGYINVIYQANEKLKHMAVFTILRSIISVPLFVLSLQLGYGILALIIIDLSATGIVLIANYRTTRKYVNFNAFSKFKWITSYIKKGFSFSIINFLNILSNKTDLLMLSFLTTPENVGIYALAHRLVRKGLIIRRPISTALFPYYTKINNTKGTTPRQLIQHSLLVLVPSVVVSVIIISFSKWLIISVAGPDFTESARILRVLIFYLVFNYVTIPWTLNLQTSYKESTVIKILTITAVLHIVLNILLFKEFGIIGIAYSTVVSSFVNVVLNLLFSFKVEK
jgi:O-antigen/teichoic acid export membrane protein